MELNMEPVPRELKYAIGMAWIALGTAIIVTVIDWRMKQDILNMTQAFYKIYPTPPEKPGAPREETKPADLGRYIVGDFVPRSDSVDSYSRVETTDVSGPNKSVDTSPPEDGDADWDKFLQSGGESVTGRPEDTGQV